MPEPKRYVFDAYGTLFDVHAAVRAQQGAIGATWEKLSQTWRAKHLELFRRRFDGGDDLLLPRDGRQ